jgi:hypothetical protein
MTIRCPHCGTANRAGSNYCNHCGADLRGEMPPQANAPQTSAEAENPAETAPPTDHFAMEQPWLQPVEDAEADAKGPSEVAPARRLIGNVQGLLDPVRVFNEAGAYEGERAETSIIATPVLAPPSERLRRFRALMAEEPVLREALPPLLARNPSRRRPPLLFLLLGVLVLFSFGQPPPSGEQRAVQPWPGVKEAYAAIEAAPPGAPVLLLWAYDPATAGEMDLLALPLLTHLAGRGSQPMVVSLLPNGLATARRLFAEVAAADVETRMLQLAVGDAQMTTSAFLPGGAALPLIGQDLATGLNVVPGVGAASAVEAVASGPVLAILLAAQAEDVQEWLEQAQPLNQLGVVAFTSAAAEPFLRPYLESRQLRGLVGGFDGAWAYQQESQYPLAPESFARLNRQLSRQTWGQIAFVLAIILGNLAALFGREHHE